MGPTWGPPGDDMTQVGPMLAIWTLLSAVVFEVFEVSDSLISLRPRQNGRHFTDDNTKCIFLNGTIWVLMKKITELCSISNIPSLVQIMTWRRPGDKPLSEPMMVIGIDHDTVCAGVGGTAIRHSTSCAGRRAAACGRHNECCAWWQYHPRQRRPYKWSISILPRSQFYKKQGKLAFSTSCTAVRPHRRLRNDAWRRDS